MKNVSDGRGMKKNIAHHIRRIWSIDRQGDRWQHNLVDHLFATSISLQPTFKKVVSLRVDYFSLESVIEETELIVKLPFE